MSPRREDYIPPVALPKIGTARPSSRSRSFLVFDDNPNLTSTTSEYRLRFPNHNPKRPYLFHAQRSHVFDYVPMPIDSKISSRLDSPSSSLRNTEYEERFPNYYHSYIPIKDLVPPHLSTQPNLPSATQLKKERMTRSQYFNELIMDSDKFNGGRRFVGNSESHTAFQWPYHIQQKPQLKSYSTMTLYEPMPPTHREVFNVSN
jgi:hypothetical protein